MASHLVIAPMTGRVIEILVAAGEPIEEGHLLVVIESMKMENELFAAVTGTVIEVKIQSDQTVMEGDTLVVIEV